MPEDLAQQIPYIRRALEAYRIPILELAGFEADDVIGTLARKAAAANHPVYVVSSDKDMMQARQRRRSDPQSSQRQSDLRRRQGRRNSRSSSRASCRYHGPPRRCHRQYPRSPRHRRQRIRRNHQALRNRRAGSRPRQRSRKENLPRIPPEQSRHHHVQQKHGHYRHQRSSRIERRSHARRRARSRSAPPAFLRTGIHFAAEGTATRGTSHRSPLQRSPIRRGCGERSQLHRAGRCISHRGGTVRTDS